MFGRAGTELGLIHQVEAGWTTLHTVDVVLEYRNLKYNKTSGFYMKGEML